MIFVEGSGSYGTNGADHAAADALLLSKTLGRPVRVQWSRQDEHAWDPKGPQQLLDLRASLDAGGRLTGWQTEMWIPTNRRGARILLAAEAAGLPQDNGRDAAAIYENGDPSYAVDHVRVVAHWLRTPAQPVEPASAGNPRTCSRWRASPMKSQRQRTSTRWRSGGSGSPIRARSTPSPAPRTPSGGSRVPRRIHDALRAAG